MFYVKLRQWKVARQEKKLIRRLSQGDTIAYRELTNRHFDELSHYVIVRTKSPVAAKALLRQLFHSVWLERATMDPTRSFASQLFPKAQEAVFAYLKATAKDQKLLTKLWLSIRSKQHRHSEPEIQKDYDLVIKTVQTAHLQRQLIYQRTTQA